MSTNLTNPESPEWEELLEETLGSSVHPDRKKGFLLSREALKQGLEDLGRQVSIKNLKLAHHHQLLGFPELTLSLSHTKACGAAIVAERKVYRSVGIDVEDESRVVKDSILERIAHPLDHNFRNIELWCAKEAAFKALMNSGVFEKPIEFGSIQITEGRWIHSASKLEGTWKMKHIKPFLMALAFLKNERPSPQAFGQQ